MNSEKGKFGANVTLTPFDTIGFSDLPVRRRIRRTLEGLRDEKVSITISQKIISTTTPAIKTPTAIGCIYFSADSQLHSPLITSCIFFAQAQRTSEVGLSFSNCC